MKSKFTNNIGMDIKEIEKERDTLSKKIYRGSVYNYGIDKWRRISCSYEFNSYVWKKKLKFFIHSFIHLPIMYNKQAMRDNKSGIQMCYFSLTWTHFFVYQMINTLIKKCL